MAYQQTTATSIADLIDRVAAFAALLGWAINRNTLVASNRTVSLSRPGSDHVHLFNTDATGVRLRGSTGLNVGAAIASQPGVSVSEALANGGAGPFATVFMFGNNIPSPYVHVVFDTGNSIFRHFHFGLADKTSPWTGGTFFEATFAELSVPTLADSVLSHAHHLSFSSFDFSASFTGGIRVDFDGNINYFAPLRNEIVQTGRVVHGGVLGQLRDVEGFYSASVNSWSGVTPLRAIKLRAERASGFWSELGHVPGMRMVNMARWSTGAEFSIGQDTWKVFPFWRHGFRPAGDTTSPFSGNFGFAYLRTP